jgi:hypothetical protein
MDIFNGVSAADIEDVSERYLPLEIAGKDSDTVKRINLNGDIPLFVIALVEHESSVNFRASFKMLLYIVMVLDAFEKEMNAATPGNTLTKGFKYPPILPIIFYDGNGKWTAETNFINRTSMNDIFYKYIPKFEYELVNLNEYSQADLVKFGDALSLIMLIDKIKTADGIHALGNLPTDYVERLALNIPPQLNKLISDVVTLLLTKVNVPSNEIDTITDKIHRKEYPTMFTLIEEYDVQATRREAREEGMVKGKLEGELEGKLIAAINIIKEIQLPLSRAMSIANLQEANRPRLIEELTRMDIAYTE